MKKLTTILGAFLLCVCFLFAGCSPTLTMPTGDIKSNGGSSVVIGEYVYFANTYLSTSSLKTGDNDESNVKHNAIYRVKTQNGLTTKDDNGNVENVEKVSYNNELLGCKEKTRKMLELIPEGGNFTDIPKDHPLYVKGMISHVYRRINRSEPAKTIIAAGGGGTWGYHYPEPRPLTNRERARLQSFPDDFIFSGNITEVRRQIGNAVPPKLAFQIANSVKEVLDNE